MVGKLKTKLNKMYHLDCKPESDGHSKVIVHPQVACSIKLPKMVENSIQKKGNRTIEFKNEKLAILRIDDAVYEFQIGEIPSSEMYRLSEARRNLKYMTNITNRLKPNAISLGEPLPRSKADLTAKSNENKQSLTVISMDQLIVQTNETVATDSKTVRKKHSPSQLPPSIPFSATKKPKITIKLPWCVCRNVSMDIQGKHIQNLLSGINFKAIYGVVDLNQFRNNVYTIYIEFHTDSGVEVATKRNGESVLVNKRDVSIAIEAVDGYLEANLAKSCGFNIEHYNIKNAVELSEKYFSKEFAYYSIPPNISCDGIHPNMILSQSTLKSMNLILKELASSSMSKLADSSLLQQVLSGNAPQDRQMRVCDELSDQDAISSSITENLFDWEWHRVQLLCNSEVEVKEYGYMEERLERLSLYLRMLLLIRYRHRLKRILTKPH